MNLQGRDYIETQDWSRAELEHLLDFADRLKADFHGGRPTILLPNQTVYLLFSINPRANATPSRPAPPNSARTPLPRLPATQISHGETPRDTGIILGSMGHAIAIRHDLIPGAGNSYMREVAEATDVPVINMQCDIDHPTQTLADLMTLRERFGNDLRGRKIVVSWAFAPSYAKPLSVPQGLITLMPRFGLDVVLAHPPEYRLMDGVMEAARKNAREAGVKFEVTDDMDAAFEGADVVYPKSWGAYD
jgi:N-acetylornithine carbamoyltransferase